MKNSEMTVALELIKSGDAEALRELVCEGKDTDEFVFGGNQIRAIVTAIALAVRPGHALMDFAIDLAAPWVDVLSLCEMVDMMIPRAGITEVSPSVDEDISVKSLMESGEFASKVSEMDDEFVRSIFLNPQPSAQAAFDEAMAKYGPNATVIAMPYGGATLPCSE